MNPKALKGLSYMMVTGVMAVSAVYWYKTWQNDDPKWYFLIMAFGIGLLLSYNLLVKRKD